MLTPNTTLPLIHFPNYHHHGPQALSIKKLKLRSHQLMLSLIHWHHLQPIQRGIRLSFCTISFVHALARSLAQSHSFIHSLTLSLEPILQPTHKEMLVLLHAFLAQLFSCPSIRNIPCPPAQHPWSLIVPHRTCHPFHLPVFTHL